MISAVSHIYFSDFLGFLSLVKNQVASKIDSGISQAVRDANKISMTKNIFKDGSIEIAVTAEKIVSREILLTICLTMVALSISPVILG